jgi:chromate reductase, NAD(P)H dehydrogenase (quinone)
MITIISGTNRPGSYTERVAEVYRKRMELKGQPCQVLKLIEMPQDLIVNEMYDAPGNPAMKALEDLFLIPAQKFVFIAPEYNGSFPGVLKAFIDASDLKHCFHHKKAALVGIADGRAGNLRGMEHLTNILNHMKINVLHLKLPISNVSAHFDEAGEFTSVEAIRLMDTQIEMLQSF